MARVLAIDPDRRQPELLKRFADELVGHEMDAIDSWAEAFEYIDVRVPDLVIVALSIQPGDGQALADHLRDRLKGNRRDILPDQAFSSLPVSNREAPRWLYWLKPADASASTARAGARRFVDEIKGYLDFAASEALSKAAPPPPPDVMREWSDPPRPVAPPIEYIPPAPPPAPARIEGPPAPPAAPEPVVIPMAKPHRLPPPPPMSVPMEPPAPPVRREKRQPLPVAEWVALASRWAMPVAAILVLGVGVVAGARWYTSLPPSEPAPKSTSANVAPPKSKPVPVAVRKGRGLLKVTSAPDGATVLVDGKKRGMTPITIDDLPNGTHYLSVESASGTVRSAVDIKPGEMAVVDASIFPGWLALFSPIELKVSEHGRTVVFDDKSQTMLAPGHHELTLVNDALGFREVRGVDLKPGETTPVSITLPKTTITVTAVPGAAVSIDGTPVGQTPLVDLPVELGTREIVLNNPVYGERRLTITATVKPVRVDVDLTKPGL